MHEQVPTRIMAVVPVRNEADRYLQACLTHLYWKVGVTHILVLDDGSEDDSFEVARQTLQDLWQWNEGFQPTWRIDKRPDDVLPFRKDEGVFRSWLMQTLVQTFRPRHGIDWILVNDADEFLVTPLSVGIRTVLRGTIESVPWDVDALTFGLDELWHLDPPRARVDKAWGSQSQLRVFRYRSDRLMLTYPGKLACGSVPAYARELVEDVQHAIRIAHAGYAVEDDRPAKYQRYSGVPGHSFDHIESILDKSVELVPVSYAPEIWRGRK